MPNWCHDVLAIKDQEVCVTVPAGLLPPSAVRRYLTTKQLIRLLVVVDVETHLWVGLVEILVELVNLRYIGHRAVNHWRL